MLFLASGCAANPKIAALQNTNRAQALTIEALNEELTRLNRELDHAFASRDGLTAAKAELEESLRPDIAAGDMSVSMQARGLVVTVLDRVLFDSGRADLKPYSRETLDKVADILTEKVADHRVYVEGHTDDVPIRRSGWRSNWELSTTRATEVVHYFIDYRKIHPRRIAAVGYGEFQPIASNETPEGRQKNRRVEIVISPQKITV